MGGHHNTFPFTYDEEKDDNLDECPSVYMTLWHSSSD